MTAKEVRETIINASETEWFNSINLTIDYPHISFSQDFKGFGSIHKFLSNQSKGWEKHEDLPNELEQSKKKFSSLKDRLENFLISHKDQPFKSNLDNYWRTEESQLKSKAYLFVYDSPITEFLIQVHQDYPKYFQGAYKFIIGSNNINDRDGFIGSIMAYEFYFKDDTEILQRRKKETSSLRKIKNDLRNQIAESESHLTEYLDKSQVEYWNYIRKIDEFKTEKEDVFDSWFNESKSNFNNFDNESKEKITSLEKTYEEILRLKKPAEYWNKRASKLKKEGWKAIYWLIGMIAFACITLYLLLWLTPEGMLLSFKGDQYLAIKWSLIYVTFLSFLAYGIRALNKVAFSSFHLARDAEEREQLTYVYLSLIKESAVDEKEKSLIMQSLFSRADTGLLKDVSSPTMPNDITGKIFGK